MLITFGNYCVNRRRTNTVSCVTFFSSHQQSDEKTNFGKLVQADMITLGCAIVEMLMPGKVQLSTCGLTGRQRERAIAKLCETNDKLLPRFVKRARYIQVKFQCP